MTYEQKIKLKDLCCKAWGITENEYYCKWCGDFDLDDMYKAYRRGKNKGARMYEVSLRDKIFLSGLLKEQTETTIKIDKQLTEAKEIIREYLSLFDKLHNTIIFNIDEDLKHKAEAFLKE